MDSEERRLENLDSPALMSFVKDLHTVCIKHGVMFAFDSDGSLYYRSPHEDDLEWLQSGLDLATTAGIEANS
jgi:hypothetical protein